MCIVTLAVVLAAGGFRAAGPWAAAVPQAKAIEAVEVPLSIVVIGLPDSGSAQLFEVTPLGGGAYKRTRSLGISPNGHFSASVMSGRLVDSEPLMIGQYERYAVVDRFIAIPADGSTTVTAAYMHQFNVTVVIWTHLAAGAAPSVTGNSSGGTVSPGAGWFAAGGTAHFLARPAAGARFLHWAVYGASERVDTTKAMATDPQLGLTLERPIQLVAAFG